MIGFSLLLLKAAGVVVLAAAASSPVAVVEDVSGNPDGIQFMDYVEAGRDIKLGPQDSIVLGYLTSCWRETITGGTVTVGTERSDVQDGMVERSTVTCAANKMQLTAELASKSGAMVFRDMQNDAQHPQLTIYGRSPMIEVKPDEGTLTVERIDRSGETHRIAVTADQLVHGTFIDLAKTGVELAAGGVYRAKTAGQGIVFKVDPDALSGESPILGRLVRLQPAT